MRNHCNTWTKTHYNHYNIKESIKSADAKTKQKSEFERNTEPWLLAQQQTNGYVNDKDN